MSEKESGFTKRHYSEKGGHYKRGQYSRLKEELSKLTDTPFTSGMITEIVVFDTSPPLKKKR